jgi:hypothetical protein
LRRATPDDLITMQEKKPTGHELAATTGRIAGKSNGFAAIGMMLAALLLAVAPAAQPRTTAKMHKTVAKWKSEPTTFMSLALGGTIQPDGRCPSSGLSVREATSTPPAPCWQGESNVKSFYDLPSPGFQIDSVVAVTYNDTIGTVIVNGMRPEYSAMKHYLLETYGPPTQSEMKPMGQQGGMMLGVESLRWEGKYVAIQLDEIYNRVDMFRVVAIHKPSTLHTAMLTE